MRKLIFTLLILSGACYNIKTFAQCPAGQMDVKISVATDDYGYESYWQLVPSGNACGTGTLWEGGNDVQVGCTGGGEMDATTAYGYGDNVIVTEDAGCLDEGFYDIVYVDDYGDGGMSFTVTLDDLYPMYDFDGTGSGNVFDFEVKQPLDYDAAITEITTNPYVNPGDIIIGGEIFNYSANTITTIEVTYSIDGGTEMNTELSGLNITPFTSYEFSHPVPWNVSINGTYSLELSSGQINGNDDMNTLNDFMIKNIIVGDPVPDIIDDYLSFVEDYEVIGSSSDGIDMPTDLDFYPVLTDYQVWVTNKGTEASGGSTVTFWNAGNSGQTSEEKQDGNAWHFMSLPTAIAFSENTNFATAPGVKDANHSGGTFTGPTLWSSDMSIYAEPSGGNGSHIDMLHQSPFTMGICAERANGFYAFCDWHNHIHYYNFMEDHGPGNDDHSDGIVRQYTDFDVEKINDDLPCHLALDKNKVWLYIVDAGNGRIVKLNTTTGTIVDDWNPSNEPLAESTSVEGAEWYEIVTDGLDEPVGIDVIDDRMLVGDHANGDIIIYDISAVPALELGRIHTERTGLMGLTIGPDGYIWFVDQDENEMVRINITNTVSIDDPGLQSSFSLFPNPSDGIVNLDFSPQIQNVNVNLVISDDLGRIIYNENALASGQMQLDISGYPAGSYTMKVITGNEYATKQIVIIE